MAYLNLLHFDGDPDDLLARKQRHVDPVTAQDIGDPMETAKTELPEATKLCNNVMDIIRKELYAGPGRMQSPRRRQDLSKMTRDDVGT